MLSERDSPDRTNPRLVIVGDGTRGIAGPALPQHRGACERQDTASSAYCTRRRPRGPAPVATGADPADHGAVAA